MKEGDVVVLLGADPTIAGAWAFRPVTAADLEGDKVWWCAEHDASYQREPDPDPPTWGCWATDDDPLATYHCRKIERLLIPIPEQQEAGA